MLYPLTRPLAKIALSVFFRKLYLSGLENLDLEKPVILAANHPTAFIEPCILACWLPKPLHFMVRGDLFLKPLSNWALRDLNMIPMFRIGDAGVSGVKANYRSVEEAAQVLRNHHPVLILAEGATAHEKRLRPLQKGTARIALGTGDQYPSLDIQVVPVGVNYAYADRFRSEAMIHFGEPISVRDYLETYRDNASNGLRDLTEALRVELEKHVVIIEEEGDEIWTDQLLEIYRHNRPESFAPQTVIDGSRLSGEIALTRHVNAMKEPEKSRWKREVEGFSKELKRYGASDRGLMAGAILPWLSLCILLIGAPVYLVALLFHTLPLWLAGRIGYGKMVPRYEFKASVALAVGLGAYTLWALLLFILAAVFWGLPAAVLISALGLGMAGWFALWYQYHLGKWSAWLERRRIPAGARAGLMKAREEICTFFQL